MDQCTICQYFEKENISIDGDARNNPCFHDREHVEEYRPSKKSKETIVLSCAKFSHVRSAVLYYRKKAAEE